MGFEAGEHLIRGVENKLHYPALARVRQKILWYFYVPMRGKQFENRDIAHVFYEALYLNSQNRGHVSKHPRPTDFRRFVVYLPLAHFQPREISGRVPKLGINISLSFVRRIGEPKRRSNRPPPRRLFAQNFDVLA